MTHFQRLLLNGTLFCALSLLALGCAASMAEMDEDHVGTVRMSLVSTTAEGVTYRLRGAVFSIEGPVTAVLSSEVDAPTDAPVLDALLPPGSYEMRLEEGWSLYREGPGGVELWVPASITSDNPVGFAVEEGGVSDVRFRFLIGPAPAADERGDVTVGFEVEEAPCPLYYADCDGDGYAAAGAETTRTCSPSPAPPSACDAGVWSERAPVDADTTDCWDQNADAHPQQPSFFTTPIAGREVATGFDYDCNGWEQRQSGSLWNRDHGGCNVVRLGFGRGNCMGNAGWVATEVPACGVRTLYTECARNHYDQCRRSFIQKTQRCR